jgi:hypothetical protein
MVDEFGLRVIDATRSIEEQQNEVRAIVERELFDVPKHPLPIRTMLNFDFREG